MSASQDAQALGEVGRAFYAAINACANPDQLVGLNKKLWAEAHPRGWVNDDEATYLTACIERRRPTGPRMQPAGTPNVGRLAGRLQPRFKLTGTATAVFWRPVQRTGIITSNSSLADFITTTSESKFSVHTRKDKRPTGGVVGKK